MMLAQLVHLESFRRFVRLGDCLNFPKTPWNDLLEKIVPFFSGDHETNADLDSFIVEHRLNG